MKARLNHTSALEEDYIVDAADISGKKFVPAHHPGIRFWLPKKEPMGNRITLNNKLI